MTDDKIDNMAAAVGFGGNLRAAHGLRLRALVKLAIQPYEAAL